MGESLAVLAAPPFEDVYRVEDAAKLMTPALVLYPDLIEANITNTLRLMGGDAGRWRPHVKTSKLASVMRRLIERGVPGVKCSTTLELATACDVGAPDVLVAYPMVGANARRVRQIAARFPAARVSVLVESVDQVAGWKGSGLGLFVDVNPGMNRTGIEQARADEILRVVRAVGDAGLAFRGLHYYDGHMSAHPWPEREAIAHRGYDRLLELVSFLSGSGAAVEEVVTSGTPAFPCTLSYPGFRTGSFRHRASPGTVVYGDCTSRGQLPPDLGYRSAALVVTTVVSHPAPRRITCDAGHKSVSADAGAPTCVVMGHPELTPERPSEEHLPMSVADGAYAPAVGELLYLVPRHICPTVNNFDFAVTVSGGRLRGVERVTARGRESPLPSDV